MELEGSRNEKRNGHFVFIEKWFPILLAGNSYDKNHSEKLEVLRIRQILCLGKQTESQRSSKGLEHSPDMGTFQAKWKADDARNTQEAAGGSLTAITTCKSFSFPFSEVNKGHTKEKVL